MADDFFLTACKTGAILEASFWKMNGQNALGVVFFFSELSISKFLARFLNNNILALFKYVFTRN